MPPTNLQDRRNQTAHQTLDGISLGLRRLPLPPAPPSYCRRCLWRLRPDGSRRSWRVSHPRVRTHHPFLPRPWRGLGWAGPLAGYPSFGWASSLTGYSGLGWATHDIRRLPDTPCPDTVSLCDYLPSSSSRDISPSALHNLHHYRPRRCPTTHTTDTKPNRDVGWQYPIAPRLPHGRPQWVRRVRRCSVSSAPHVAASALDPPRLHDLPGSSRPD